MDIRGYNLTRRGDDFRRLEVVLVDDDRVRVIQWRGSRWFEFSRDFRGYEGCVPAEDDGVDASYFRIQVGGQAGLVSELRAKPEATQLMPEPFRAAVLALVGMVVDHLVDLVVEAHDVKRGLQGEPGLRSRAAA